jgi:hypothetical protein
MDFFETPEEVGQQLDDARSALKAFEEDVESSQLLGRLQNAHPFHPALMAKSLFLVLFVLGIVASAAGFAVPFVLPNPPEWIAVIEFGTGLPLPVVFGVVALCMAIAWLMTGQAALVIARDYPMVAWEQREHERLTNEVKRIMSQKAIMDRARGTPGHRPRTMTPAPVSGRGAPTSRASSSGGGGAPPRANARLSPMPFERSYTAPIPDDSLDVTGGGRDYTPSVSRSRFGTPARASQTRTNEPVTRPNVGLAAHTIKGRPNGAGLPFVVPDDELTDPPDSTSETSERNLLAEVPELDVEESAGTSDDIQDYMVPVNDVVVRSQGGFEQRYATHFPNWGAVDEPWLEDAIQKSEVLATSFPVQAHLEFSAEPNLPFTLILERATPAMAVRAMVSYVEFLASIATPPRARIVMRSVPHLDRSFHRNVEAALEPYFGEKGQVARQTDHIDITFADSDPAWRDHPFLPIAADPH